MLRQPRPANEGRHGPPAEYVVLAAALEGLEAQKARIDTHIAEVRRVLGARTQRLSAPKTKPKISAAGRKRIVEATRKRWTEFHRQQAEVAKGAGTPTMMKKAARGRKTAAAKVAAQPAAGIAVE